MKEEQCSMEEHAEASEGVIRAVGVEGNRIQRSDLKIDEWPSLPPPPSMFSSVFLFFLLLQIYLFLYFSCPNLLSTCSSTISAVELIQGLSGTSSL